MAIVPTPRIKITYPGSGNNSALTYDSVGRLVRVAEKIGDVLVSDKQFVLYGEHRSEERDSSGAVSKSFFKLGEQVTSTSYYFVMDQNGSVREVTNSLQQIQAQMTYDMFGRKTRIQTGFEPDFQYGYYFVHSRSSLLLTSNRCYQADMGRWISRDPIAETGGINLFAYVSNAPVDATDPSGLSGPDLSKAKPGVYSESELLNLLGLPPDSNKIWGGCVDVANYYLDLPPGSTPEKNVRYPTHCFKGNVGLQIAQGYSKKHPDFCCNGHSQVWGKTGNFGSPGGNGSELQGPPFGNWDPVTQASGVFDYITVHGTNLLILNHGSNAGLRNPWSTDQQGTITKKCPNHGNKVMWCVTCIPGKSKK